MVAIYKTVALKDNESFIQLTVEEYDFLSKKQEMDLESDLNSSSKRIPTNYVIAASDVYSQYQTTTHATAKQDTTTLPAQTVATYIINNKRPTIIVYPTVSPESIVIPIVSCILGFPLLALLVICCLRRRAKLARERVRRRNYDLQDHAVSLVRFSQIHRLNNRSSRAISLRPERSLSRGFPSLELDTVLEERSDIDQTQTEIINSDSAFESTSQHNSCSS